MTLHSKIPIIFIITLAIIAGGVWYVKKLEQTTPLAEDNISVVQDEIVDEDGIDTRDWKKFWIEDLGIYFQYPNDFIILNRWYKKEQQEKLRNQRAKGRSNSRRKKSTFEQIASSTLTRQIGRTVARELTRGILGALGVSTTRRRRRKR